METGVLASTLAPLLAGIVSTATVFVLLRTRGLPLDEPNERSLHLIPVPRTGGIAIITGVVAAAVWLRASPSLLVPAVALAIASYFDDRHALPAAVRLVMHLVAAGVFLWLAAGSSGAVLLVVLLLAIAWITNLYNFMDGADGLSGGMAVIGFGTYGLAAWLGGNGEFEALAWSIAAAAVGFLIFNFPPTKIFMGDVGSIPLGFLAGAFGVAGWQQGLWPLWFPLVVFAPFIVDASMTLARDPISVRCARCRSSGIHMSIAQVLKGLFPDLSALTVYEMSSRGPLFEYLKGRAGRLTCSEYFDDVAPGQSKGGVQCQDVERLTFPDSSFDLCTSTGVFEHVPDDENGFREIRRVLKPGGRFIFTVPLSDSPVTVKRAEIIDGEVRHLLPPEYHGDAIRGQGRVLVYRDYGRDLVTRLGLCGFANATIVDVDDAQWWGLGQSVIVAEAYDTTPHYKGLCR